MSNEKQKIQSQKQTIGKNSQMPLPYIFRMLENAQNVIRINKNNLFYLAHECIAQRKEAVSKFF